MLALALRIAIDAAFGWMMIGSLVWFAMATAGGIENAYLRGARRVGWFHLVRACLWAMVIWPKILRKLLRHPHLGKRLARNLWGRP
jgi:hypothetical protein